MHKEYLYHSDNFSSQFCRLCDLSLENKQVVSKSNATEPALPPLCALHAPHLLFSWEKQVIGTLYFWRIVPSPCWCVDGNCYDWLPVMMPTTCVYNNWNADDYYYYYYCAQLAGKYVLFPVPVSNEAFNTSCEINCSLGQIKIKTELEGGWLHIGVVIASVFSNTHYLFFKSPENLFLSIIN